MDKVKNSLTRGPSVPLFIFILLGVLALLSLNNRLMSERVPYSTFRNMLAQGQLKEVQLGPEVVRAVVKGPAGSAAGAVGQGTAQNPAQSASQPVQTAPVLPGTTGAPALGMGDGVGCAGPSNPGQRIIEAVRVDDPELIKLLESQQIEYHAVVSSGWLTPMIMWLGLPLLLFFILNQLSRRAGAGGQGPQAMMFGRNRARVVAEEGTGITFNDVAGIDEAKEELEEVIAFLKTPERFQKLGGKIPRGVLLVGPPGTGKTLLAKAVAGEAGVPFFSLSGSDFVEMFVGVGAARVRDLFEQAVKRAPCIVFIDELDALGKARGAGGPVGSNDEREQTLNQLLVEMDGFDLRKGVIIMAATNRPEILDPALLRPGRFDRTITVGRPDIKGREQILKVHAAKVKLGPDVELKVLAQRTPGFAGADLANIVNEAALLAARKNKEQINLSDFDDAIERVVAGLSKKHGLLNPREKRIVAYHESGHTVVAASVKHADPVHKVSIIPRGIGALGYTLQMPLEDRYLMGKGEMEDRIAILMGGRAAEAILFEDVSTGASDDLSRATEMARRMVMEYGMSERLGNRVYGESRRGMMGDNGGWPFGPREYSEETQRAIDAEVNRIVTEGYDRAYNILMKRRDDLEVLATRLLQDEVVDRDALDRILGIERDGDGRPTNPYGGAGGASSGALESTGGVPVAMQRH